MGDRTAIEWAANADGTPGATWNPIRARHTGEDSVTRVGTHCVHASEGCRNCYAETMNMRKLPGNGTGLPYAKQSEAKLEIFLAGAMLTAPLRRRKPTTYFLSSMTDVFADFVSDDMLNQLFAVMALSPQHTFIVLTKRAERMRAYMTHVETEARWMNAVAYLLGTVPGLMQQCHPILAQREPWLPLPNVCLGVSVENQPTADERSPHLLATPARWRAVSAEPLLGAVDFTRMWLRMPGGGESLTNVLRSGCEGTHKHNGDPAGHDHGAGTSRHVGDPRFPHHHHDEGCRAPRLDWVICGGESGPQARPMHPDWARELRDQCAAAGVPFFFKQWGEWAPHAPRAGGDLGGDMRAGRVLFVQGDGRDPDGHFRKGDEIMARLGKGRAGRLLDGVEHNARPAFHEIVSREGEALATRVASPGRPAG